MRSPKSQFIEKNRHSRFSRNQLEGMCLTEGDLGIDWFSMRQEVSRCPSSEKLETRMKGGTITLIAKEQFYVTDRARNVAFD